MFYSQFGGKCSLQLSSPSVGIFSIKFPEMLASWAGGADEGEEGEESLGYPCDIDGDSLWGML